MFHFCSLFSSSEGNSAVVQSDHTNLLVDVGVSCIKIEKALNSIDTNIHDIQGILITHEHSDHIKGLSAISRKYGIPVYANQNTWEHLPREVIKEDNQRIFSMYESFSVGDLEVFPFELPHDAANPSGFHITYQNTKMSIATDLGHVTDETLQLLENSKFIMLESNYDPEVLRCSSYPYLLKSRIAGPKGHLSNSLAGKTISRLIDSGLTSAMLGHLSKETNFPELAYHTVLEEMQSSHSDKKAIELTIASRFGPTKLIDII